MAYKAYLNNTELFFDSSVQDGSFLLTYAVLKLQYGSAGQFTFRIPPENSHYDDFQRVTSFIDVYRDDDLIFSGRVYSITDRFNLEREIVCEGLLALLNDSIFRPVLHDGTLHGLVRKIVASHNEQVESSKQLSVGVITVSDAACYRDYQNYETSISRMKDLVDSFGGYLHIKKTNGQLTLNWYQDMIDATSQKIELASNLIDIQQTVDSSGVITVLIPLGAETEDGTRLTVKSVNSGKDYITASAENISKYGYIVGSQVWNDITTPAMLMYRGNQYLAASLTPRTTINLTAVDLADAGYDVDSFLPGQKITVLSVPHGINNVQFLCQNQTLNLLQPAQNKLTLGEVRPGFVQNTSKNSADAVVEQIASKYATKTALDTAVDQATSIISGNSGGHVVMHDSDGDTHPDELLIMDTDDIDTAVKVWRFNNSGLGYSSTGYNGTYGLAMTMDGGIVADRINTGTLNGNLIRAGVIRGQQGNSYWDLNTGVLHIEGTGDDDKSKVFIYEPVPPYYVGDLWVTQRDDSSGVVGYMVAGYGVVGNTASGEGGKIMTCIYTRTSGDFDESDWSLITNYVSDNDLQILEQRVSAAELHIDANTASIQSKASMEVTDYLGNRIEAAESTITQQAEQIELKVSESDITGNYLVSKINLSSTTATIQASHIDLQGAVTISSFDSATAGKVVTGSTSKNQYYLSNSADSLTGGSWQNTVTWSSGKYIWTRIATTKTFADNTTSTSYSDAIYDANLTAANVANVTAKAALSKSESVYYRSTSSTTPTISASTSIGTAVNTDNAWEYVMPRPKRGCYFFTCEKYTDKAGNVSFSTVRQMPNANYTSLWCSSTDSTYIDGAYIYTGTLSADKITTGTLSFNRCSGGTLKLGGSNNQSGALIVYNASGAEIGRWDKDGATIRGNVQMVTSDSSALLGSSYFMYVSNNGTLWSSFDGFLVTDKNSSGTTTSKWMMDGATLYQQTRSTSYNERISVLPNANLDGSTKPTSGVIVTRTTDTQSDTSDGTINAYKIDVYDISSTVKKHASCRFGWTHIFLGTNEPGFPTASSAPTIATADTHSIRLDMNTHGMVIKAGTQYIRMIDKKFYAYVGANNYMNLGSDRFEVYASSTIYMRLTNGALGVCGKYVQFTSSSSQRYKHNITTELSERNDPHRLYELPVKQFVYNEGHQLQYDDMEGEELPGFIAEDVEEIYPSAVIHNADGEVESWDERRLIPGMLKLIQEQKEMIDTLTARIDKLEAIIKEVIR